MLNRIVMIGRLTRDPELRRTTSGVSVASFTVACDDSFKGPNGEKSTVFMNCSCFRGVADNVAKFTRKGSLVAVYGRITQRKYVNRDNVQVTVTEINADGVEFLEPKSANAAQAGYTPDAPATGFAPDTPSSNDSNLDSIDVIEDDLPF